MKVITEEMLDEIESLEDDKDFPFNNHGLKEVLSKYLVEIDQLTVTKLRPMSDAPRDGQSFLGYGTENEYFTEVYFDLDINEFSSEGYVVFSEYFKGWIPMPIYRPKNDK